MYKRQGYTIPAPSNSVDFTRTGSTLIAISTEAAVDIPYLGADQEHVFVAVELKSSSVGINAAWYGMPLQRVGYPE